MILQQELLQEMADRIIDDIGYNINIIDKNGIIVASGSRERIGDFHAIGHEAATKEERIDINSETVHLYQGVKEGINQPFYYRNQLAGVIGITGNSEEINDFVKVVKTMIEVMVEQERLKERMFLRQNSKTQFVNLLLNHRSDDDISTLEQWSRQLDYNFNIPRIVIILQLNDQEPDADIQEALKIIKKVSGHGKEDFSSILSASRLVIFKYIQPDKQFHQLKTYVHDIHESLKKSGMSQIKIGTGSLYSQIQDMHKAFDEAIFCLDHLETSGHSIGFIDDYLFQYFLKQLPESFFSHFIENYYSKISSSVELMETLVALTKNQLNLVETSKSMYVHRNTVVFRLNKIKELTGLDPHNGYRDRNLFELMAYYYEVFERNRP